MEPASTPRAIRRRTIAVAGLAVLVSSLFLIVPLVLRGIAHSALASLGFADVKGGSVTLGLGHVRIADMRIGQKGRASVAVTYSPSALLRGRLRAVDVTGTILHGVVALDGTLALDGYAPPPGKAGGPIALPVETVTVEALRLDLETPLGDAVLLGNGVLTGADDGLHLTGRADLVKDGIDGTAPADFALSPEGWSLTLDPIRLGLPAEAGVANALNGRLAMAKHGTEPVTGTLTLDGEMLTFGALAARKLSIGFHTGADGQSAMLRYLPADGSTGISGDLRNDMAGLTADVAVAFNDFGPVGKAFGWGTVSGPVRASLTIRAAPGTATRALTAKVTYDGAAPGGIALRDAELDVAGTFDPAANAVSLTGCNAVSAERVTVAGLALSKLSGCIGPTDGMPLFAQDKTGAIALAMAVKNFAASLPTAQAAGDTALAEAAIASLSATVAVADGRVTRFHAAGTGGTVNFPGLGAGLRDLKLDSGSAANGSVGGALSGRFAAVAPNSPALPIVGMLGGDLIGGVTLDLTLGSPQHPPIIKGSVTGKAMRIDMTEIRLGEDAVDLPRLLPGIATKVSKLSGSMTFNAAADWSGAALSSHGALTLKDISATTPNFTVEGLNSSVALTSLRPLTIADDQVLTTAKLLVGVPLTDGRVVFGLNRNNILNIAEASWTVAGGTVGTHDQQLDLYGPDQHLGVVVKRVDLAELLKLVDVKGLTAEGTLDGAIPLRHTKDTILVQHGVLQTRGGGLIRYDPADTPSFLQGQSGEGTAILREVLKDFHYERLGVAIDGVLGGEEKIGMSLKGANPAAYGGSAISLNLNLSGALDSIARSSIEAYTHPTETVRRKLQKKPEEKK